MRYILAARGGSQQLLEYVLTPSLKNYFMKNSSITVNSVVTPLLSPAQSGVQQTGEVIAKNIFAEHTQRRVNQALAKKVLCSISAERAVHILPKIGVLGLIKYCSLGLGINGLGIYFGLNLLREEKQKHARMMVESKSNQVVIDVEVIDL